MNDLKVKLKIPFELRSNPRVDDQYEIFSHPARVKVICCGRRWGKSILALAAALSCACAGGKVAIVVPTYKNSQPFWRGLKAILSELKKVKLVRLNTQDKIIEFDKPCGMGMICIYSADNPDAILGEWFNLVIVDEAARVPQFVWENIIQPTLGDAPGFAILISTPKGNNWFKKEFDTGERYKKIGKDHLVCSWRRPSSFNPKKSIRRAMYNAKQRIPIKAYKQEWLAEFIDDSGDVFNNVNDCCCLDQSQMPVPGGIYIGGLDTAKINDFTVLTIFDAVTREVVYMGRWSGIDYSEQEERILAICNKYKPLAVKMETNGHLSFFERLYKIGVPVIPFYSTSIEKNKLIESLQSGFDFREFKTLNDDEVINEFKNFETRRLPSGTMRYSAPYGGYDDIVISHALAFSLLDSVNQNPLFRLIGAKKIEVNQFEMNVIAFFSKNETDEVFVFAGKKFGQENLHVFNLYKKSKISEGGIDFDELVLTNMRALNVSWVVTRKDEYESFVNSWYRKLKTNSLETEITTVSNWKDDKAVSTSIIAGPLNSRRITMSPFIDTQFWADIEGENGLLIKSLAGAIKFLAET